MPHACARCKTVFDEGADLLQGCPVCGWRKFLFVKKASGLKENKDVRTGSMASLASLASKASTASQSIHVGPEEIIRPKENPKGSKEVRIISDSKGIKKLVSDRELPKDKAGRTAEGRGAKVESIKITAPGTYELNLPSLFEREELVMAVKEGTYLIDLTSAFRKKKDSS